MNNNIIKSLFLITILFSAKTSFGGDFMKNHPGLVGGTVFFGTCFGCKILFAHSNKKEDAFPSLEFLENPNDKYGKKPAIFAVLSGGLVFMALFNHYFPAENSFLTNHQSKINYAAWMSLWYLVPYIGVQMISSLNSANNDSRPEDEKKVINNYPKKQ